MVPVRVVSRIVWPMMASIVMTSIIWADSMVSVSVMLVMVSMLVMVWLVRIVMILVRVTSVWIRMSIVVRLVMAMMSWVFISLQLALEQLVYLLLRDAHAKLSRVKNEAITAVFLAL